jgi:molybdopterin synthase catalytic subunit
MITRQAIDLGRLVAAVQDAAHGAVATFIGTVRESSHDGANPSSVFAMTYDGFEPLAAKVLQEIASEAEARWGVRVAAAHRLGRLEVGEASVAVACGSAHRSEAFDACRYVIEEIKRRLPVWKKEHFADGRTAWLEGHALAEVR